MRKALIASALALAFVFAACGGKKTPKTTTGGGSADKPAAAATCCCALASDPVTYEVQPTEKCQTDTHGTCSEDSHCKK